MKSQVKFDLSKLNTFVKSLDDKHAIQVGIFGNKNAREKGDNTNAAIGFKHEFGSVSEHIPPRSFLRMPLSTQGAKIVKEATPGAQKLLAEGKIVMLMKRIGVACEAIVDDAFASRGFGTWQENAPLTVKLKGYDSPLIQTSQLRRSISSKVVKL